MTNEQEKLKKYVEEESKNEDLASFPMYSAVLDGIINHLKIIEENEKLKTIINRYNKAFDNIKDELNKLAEQDQDAKIPLSNIFSILDKNLNEFNND